ncbi:hypothetical protein GCM10011521_00390 [Arenimonas soli]|uniref:DUF2007 domain-containing protein n=1 Tax=Arenimonas soli TaxID=2269504 RepID=A0ABQ1HAM3_9GAMM|nr:DUF2007 domain-containing protein [Arenimonas soli]GGA66248.1 hypothetical protein GCM10011521_00390 [Arenimonas soli]
MTPIYVAENELDAQLVQDLLVSAGIAAHIFGPNVADPEGGIAATRQVRVVVEDDEAGEARQLVHEWQTMPDENDDDGFSVALDDDPHEIEANVPVFNLFDTAGKQA